jgi:pimeloyl-ACP methyl ester carboxylesterase
MRYASNRGCRIAFDVAGSGPTVLLQHGLTVHRRAWHENGYVSALADAYQVVTVDSLGQGDSDKPHDCSLYGREQRAGDLVAVMDDLGVDRAHVVGYSMGGWLAGGVLVHHPERLASLVVGGFDLVGGVAAMIAAAPATGWDLGFDAFLRLARRVWPADCSWITPEMEPALRCCHSAATESGGEEAAVGAFDRPILVWSGTEDSCSAASKALADRHEQVALLEVPGNHVEAVREQRALVQRALRGFLDEVECSEPAPRDRERPSKERGLHTKEPT